MKKILSIYVWCVVVLAAITVAACSSDDDVAEPEQGVSMPVTLRFPASGATRAPGDPGSEPGINLPRYAYIFTVIKNGAAEEVICQQENLTPALWQKDTWVAGTDDPQTDGDYVWFYSGNITVDLPDVRTEGRIYAAVSYEPITFTNPTTEDGVKALKVDFTNAGTPYSDYSVLRDVYSTPCDYSIGGNYYGTVQHISTRRPSANLLLYHVASRVDILWNVREDVQANVQVKDMQLQNLKYKDCYLFRPTMNVGAGAATTTLDGPAFNEGNQWYGRHYFYVIPYRAADSDDSHFPLTVALWQGSDTHTTKTSGYFTHTFNIAAQPSGAQGDLIDNKLLGSGTVFAPWLRGLVEITEELYD